MSFLLPRDCRDFEMQWPGAAMGEVRSDILYELTLGLCYMLAGGVLFRVLESYAKRVGTYESAI